MSAVLLAGCLTASAQQDTATVTVEAFNPHWNVQAQIGGQYTLGEVDFGDLLSGNFQIAGGYKFTPIWGLRFALNAWQSKGGSDLSYLTLGGQKLGEQTWKFNYIAPTLDLTLDVTNWICGYKPDRVCNFGLLAGLGANIAWGNGDAHKVLNMIAASDQFVTYSKYMDPADQMTLLWSGTKTRFVGRFGAYLDFNISRRVALGLEMNCNVTSDQYNSKKAGNSDWYFNALAGVKVNLGKLTKRVPAPKANTIIIEKIVEKPVETIIYKDSVHGGSTNAGFHHDPNAGFQRPTLRRDIFFALRGSDVSRTEMQKILDIVSFMNKFPNTKVSITGYADKGTGNPQINVGYAQKRSQTVYDLLTKTYGIAAERVVVDSKGDMVQPYDQNNLNRVTICIAE